MTQQQPDSDSPNWDVLDELDSARKQAALRVSEAPELELFIRAVGEA